MRREPAWGAGMVRRRGLAWWALGALIAWLVWAAGVPSASEAGLAPPVLAPGRGGEVLPPGRLLPSPAWSATADPVEQSLGLLGLMPLCVRRGALRIVGRG